MGKNKTMFVLIAESDEGKKEALCVSATNGGTEATISKIIKKFMYGSTFNNNDLDTFEKVELDDCIEDVADGLNSWHGIYQFYWEELPLIQ